MPPRKRKAADADDAPELKRRVTRSASKGTAPPKETTIPKDETSAAKPSKTSKPATKPVVHNAEATEVKGEVRAARPSKKAKRTAKAASPIADETSENNKRSNNDSQTGEDISRTILTIQHDSLKKPMICHQYPNSPHATLATPGLIFTHGAGGTLDAPAVVNFCTGYSVVHPVLSFQGSMNFNARVKGFHVSISHLRLEKQSLTLGGRSMGARAAVIAGTEILSSEDGQSELSLVLVSYPLKGPKDVRDQILLDLPASVRVLFVIGEKDAMCPLDLLEETRKKMAAKTRLVVVRGADHGMHVRPVAEEKRLGEEAGRLAAAWVGGEADDNDIHIGRDEEG
ncbi:hypothetical protein PSPO01_03900 [Paraphaeosphaeria sporulosa]